MLGNHLLDGVMTAATATTGAAGLGDLFVRARTGSNRGFHALFRNALAETDEHGERL